MFAGLFLIIFLVLLIGGAIMFATVYAIVRAAKNNDVPWIIGICVGWFFGMGWVVGLVYLFTQDPARSGPGKRGYGYHEALPPSGPTVGGPPPGWHPDPQGRFESRYWDGTRWTEHVSTNGQPTTDPV